MRPAVLRFDDLTIEGWSRAGDATWFRVHPPGLAFDVGRGPRQLEGARDLFISHGHLDHSLGLPFVLSQRSLHRDADSRVFCPRPTAPALAALVAAGEALEGAPFRYELHPLDPGERVEVGRDLWVEAFATDHVVPSLGYHLVRRKRRLAAALEGLPAEEVAARRQRGEEVTEDEDELALTYCGDTGAGVFELEPRLFGSRVLMLECTFLDAQHRERGQRYRHLHLDEIAARVGDFANRDLVLYHLSRRHHPGELRRRAEEALAGIAPRLHVLLDEKMTDEP